MRVRRESGDQRTGAHRFNSGDDSKRVPPVPIPNTEVKPLSAEGTWLATAREIRTPPDSNEGISNYPLNSNRKEQQAGTRKSNQLPSHPHPAQRRSNRTPIKIILSSSMAEHSAVNRRVVGSSPT